MLSLYEILKASKTGIAPNMWTGLAGANFGGSPTPTEHEYTGVVPYSFNADGTPLLDWYIKGNTVQSTRLTPQNPVMPEGCGERTGNLCPDTGWRSGQYRDGVWETTNTRSTSDFFPVSSNQYRLKINAGQLLSFINFNYFDSQKQWIGNRATLGMSPFSPTAQNIVIPQLPLNAAYMCITVRFYNDNGNPPIPQSFIDDSNIMVNEGTSELSYEPHGYKIPISSANTTTPVYLGEVETTRKIYKYEITGNETFTQSSSPLYYIINLPKAPLLRSRLYSTHFIAGASNIAEGACRFAGSEDAPDSRLIFNYDGGAGGVSNFKSWVAQQYANGTPVTVWYVLATEETGIVNEPLMKIGEYADEVANVATIPTNNGSTTIDIETTVKPSEIYIKYKGV